MGEEPFDEDVPEEPGESLSQPLSTEERDSVEADLVDLDSMRGVFEPQGYAVWFFALVIVCIASLSWGLARRQFAFVAYAAVYGYVGVSSMFVRSASGETTVLTYFVVTGIAMLVALVQIGRRFGRSA